MKILFLTIRYRTDDEDLYHNLIDGLVHRGHQITIVRSVPEAEMTSLEHIKDGLCMLNVKTPDPFDYNLIKKGLGQVFLAQFFKYAVKHFLDHEKFDLILYATPPITLAGVVDYCKKQYHAKTFLMLKDIFPQNAVDLEMIKKDSLIYKYFRRQEKKYYDVSDYIGCMSQGNKDYVLKHNPEIKETKVHIFPNTITVRKVEGSCFHENKTVFLFGGNIGKPQNIPFLLNVIKDLKDYSKAEFLVVGEGKEKAYIQEFCREHYMPNFKYVSQVPQQEYEEILKNADIGLISLDPRFTIPNIPSKMLTYLKLEKPILAVTDRNTDLKDMLLNHNCGWWCDASDKQNIIKTIKSICEHKEMQKEKGKNGYCYLERELNVENELDIIEEYVMEKVERF